MFRSKLTLHYQLNPQPISSTVEVQKCLYQYFDIFLNEIDVHQIKHCTCINAGVLFGNKVYKLKTFVFVKFVQQSKEKNKTKEISVRIEGKETKHVCDYG